MKTLLFFLTVFLFATPIFAQPDPKRVPPHSRPKPESVPQPSLETTYIPLNATAAPCQMNAANAPTIGGVKLGLSPDELGKVFKIKITPGAPNRLNVSTFDFGEQNKSALPNGINFIKLGFFNDRLFYAVMVFDNTSPPTLDKFALALSAKYNFSKAWFKTARQILVSGEIKTQVDETSAYLFCPGELRFELSVGSEAQLRMLDLKADNQKNQRQKQINSPITQ
ncbi:MAG: hypothetical protein ABI686_13450 [Acidobacteriota bacterium]